MRFLKAFIIGTIIGLAAYYIFRKRDSEEGWVAPNPPQSEQRAAVDRLDASDVPENADDSEQQLPEAEAILPEPVAAPASSETLTLSNKPYTPSLFQEPDKTERSTKRVVEVEEDLGISEQDADTDSSAVNLFGSQSEAEPPQHPGRRVQTGEYYPSAGDTSPKALLRCRDNGGEWALYLEMPDEREVVEVCHDGEQLSRDKEIELQQFTGQIILDYDDGGQYKVDLYDSAPLYFRTDDGWERDGTLAQSHSNGYFIVIAPVEMDDEFAESEHDPEDCADPGFHAHFLAISGHDSEAYGKYPATLTGNKIYDAADVDFHGELYVGQPPELSVHEMVTRARIVEETDSRRENRWGKNFDPHTQTIASVLDERDGRFTVRTYLKDSRVRHESKTFRYFKSLDHIEIDGQAYNSETLLAPVKDKSYGPSYLSFKAADGIVKPTRVDNPSVSISKDGLVNVPPNPSIKRLYFEFSNRASIVIDIPRIWWRLVDGHSYGKWNHAQTVLRDDFIRLAREYAYIEMELPRGMSSINVGFGDTLDQRVQKTGNAAKIYLIYLADHVVLENMMPGEIKHLIAQVNGLNLQLLGVHIEFNSWRSRDMLRIRKSPDCRHEWNHDPRIPAGVPELVKCALCGKIRVFQIEGNTQ